MYDIARRKMRAVLSGSACIHPASVYDPMTMRMAADLGFEAAMLAGSIASMAVLGAPDLVVLTLTELSDLAKRISRSADLPLIVDADHGFGNALNVMRTVEELESAGVSALTIEDTDLPARFGGKAGGLISVEEGVGKLKAALEARSDPQFAIIARTTLFDSVGLDGAAARIKAYEETGVDGVFIAGLKTRAQLEQLAKGSRKPLLLGGGGNLGDAKSLESLRVKVRLLGHAPFLVAAGAARTALMMQRQGTSWEPGAHPGTQEIVDQAIRKNEYSGRRKRFL